MKINIIKKYTPLVLLSASILVGCNKFEDINTNPQGVTEEMAQRDGVAAGGFIQALQRQVVPVGTAANKTDIINAYQTAYHLGPDTWSGYFGQNAEWNGGYNHTTYALKNDWVASTFKETYTNVFSPWLSIKNTGDKEAFAFAQLLKIVTWQKATDDFGPIPYTKAGDGLFVTPYDSQEVVYKTMLTDLEEAISVLTNYLEQGGKLYANYDLIYGGDTRKWIKFANSAMLRMAMRIRFVEPQLAQKYAEMAINHPVGVMTDVEDGAKIGLAQGLQFDNPIETFAGQYGECKMGTPAFSYLVGYEDPRLAKYYKTSESEYAINVPFADGKYLPIAPGASVKKTAFADCSIPNIEKTTPVRWMMTSEVYFLRAEGALIGWSMGDSADNLYKKGIETSFAENGVPTEKAEEYINSELQPSDVDLSQVPKVKRVLNAATTATVKFEGSEEQKLEKIMIQKWIALYPNGQEAWTEWRRTGYPKMQEIIKNNSNGIVNTTLGIRRFHFTKVDGRSKDEQAAYNEAVQLLGGEDNPATKLWWDKK